MSASDQTRTSLFPRVAWTVAAVIGFAALAWFLAPALRQEVPAIDLEDVASVNRTDDAVVGESMPELRIAVAAMISPKKTSLYYDQLVRAIGDRVGRRVSFAQKKTYAEVNDMVERREVDLAFVCSGPYVTGHEEFGMEILVVPVAYGATTYNSYVLTHRDSPIETLEQLRGKSFAFTDPHSNTGCLVPRYMLAQLGEAPETFFDEFIYSYSHDNSIRAVAQGLCDGAAVDHLIWEYMNAFNSSLTSKTKIMARSEPYGIPPVVVHPQLDGVLKKQLREAFLGLHEDDRGREPLAKLHIDRFVRGSDKSYDTVRKMQDWVNDRAVD